MRTHKRCPRLVNEVWKAPGGPGRGPWPDQVREMQGRCVLDEGHEQYADTPRHIFGDYLERDRVSP